MTTGDFQQSIDIKLEQANEITPRAERCCWQYLSARHPGHLVRLGSYLGTSSNNLRSALNYAIADYCQRRGFQKNRKGKELSIDFPYGYSPHEFQRRDVAALMSQSDPKLFAFIERVQPYHPDYRWIGYLMKLSNTDKHKITVKVDDLDISAMAATSGFVPQHFVSAVAVGVRNGELIFRKTPCYVESVAAFALADGKWTTFSVNLAEKEGTFVLPFFQTVPARVAYLLREFYTRL